MKVKVICDVLCEGHTFNGKAFLIFLLCFCFHNACRNTSQQTFFQTWAFFVKGKTQVKTCRLFTFPLQTITCGYLQYVSLSIHI